MATTFPCPSCQQTIMAEVAPGTSVQCPLCNRVVIVPGSPAPARSDAGGPDVHGRQGPERPMGDGCTPQLSSTLAVAALVCGIIGILTACLPVIGLVGLILGIVGLIKAYQAPDRYGGRGLAIGGICTGSVSILLFPLMVAVMVPAMSRARELAKRTICASNMQEIGAALSWYAAQNGSLPEAGADWQARLINGGYISPQQLQCPSDMSGSGSSYYYVAESESPRDPDEILLYEHTDNHGGEGGNVLYADQHVTFEKAPTYQKLIDSTTLHDGTP